MKFRSLSEVYTTSEQSASPDRRFNVQVKQLLCLHQKTLRYVDYCNHDHQIVLRKVNCGFYWAGKKCYIEKTAKICRSQLKYQRKRQGSNFELMTLRKSCKRCLCWSTGRFSKCPLFKSRKFRCRWNLHTRVEKLCIWIHQICGNNYQRSIQFNFVA